MKTLLGTMLLALAAQVHAQPLEANLDGNASALQASALKPQPQPSRKPVQVAKRSQRDETKRQRIAAR